MSNFTYNGVELPALPTWDKTTYPVAVISALLDAASSMYAGAQYILALGKSFLWLNGKCYVSAITGVYRYDGSAWVWHYGSGTTYNQDIIAPDYFEAVWTNTNIPTADGISVYLAKSDPVPVGGESGGGSGGDDEPPAPEHTAKDIIEARRRGFIAGLLAGINIRGVLSKKIITEPELEAAYYLYNGVKLPKLPVWDREAYPYAYIQETVVKGYFWLRTCEDPAVWEKSTSGNSRLIVEGNERAYYLPPESQIWEERACELVIHNEGIQGNTLIWTNNDVHTPDGTAVLVAASDPIPVYD